MAVVPGIEVIASRDRKLVGGRRVAVLAHAASVDRGLTYAWDLLADAGARVVALLGPEHGLFAEAQDMEPVADGSHAVRGRGVPVHSLYGTVEEDLALGSGMLEGAEVLVVDLKDVGSRYYTFAATADMAAAACLAAGVEVVVADRPNPLGGTVTEGSPRIAPGLRSFVGRFEVPHRHGLTIGELVLSGAGAAAGAGAGREGLRVVPCEGWTRSMGWESCGLPWVPPSPNMPIPETARVYPGGCLVEGTNLSEGRGTTRPFEIVGAPFMDGDAVAKMVNGLGLAGVRLRPIRFRPMFQKHAGHACSGVFVHVTDPAEFRSLRTYAAIIWAGRRACGDRMAWRADAYEFRSDVPVFDLLWGDPSLREGIDGDADVSEILALADRSGPDHGMTVRLPEYG